MSELTPAIPPRPGRRRRRILIWVSVVVAVLIIATLIAGDIALRRIGPVLKARVVQTLSSRFDSRVQLDQFNVSVFRGFEVYGQGLRLYPNHLQMKQPLIAVGRFSFHVLGWTQLLQSPNFIRVVRVSGLEIHLPPKSQRSQIPHLSGGSSGVSDGPAEVTVGEILVNHARLVFENDQSGKVPLTFVIHKLTLRSVAAGQPMKFHATLVNPKPLGNIDSSGDFGPFDAQNPGHTPVDGKYSFTHADLSTIRGIGGILSSKGHYSGRLNRIVVDGATDTPKFRLSMAGNPVPLKTTFHAIVDGTNGDTRLEPVDAWLAKTHIVAAGNVTRVPGDHGRDIQLTFSVDQGRMQDLLRLTEKNQPTMTGFVQLKGQMHLPPGHTAVIDKLQLQGSFALDNILFSNPKIQSRVDQLSLRGQGKAQQAQQESDALKAGHLKAASAANIPSQMTGRFSFADGILHIPALDYIVPGAEVKLMGQYVLPAQALDFTGTARLDAHVSQMVTGWKSWLLKPVNPFFSKNGAGTQVPIRITGTRAKPDIALNLGH